MLSEIARLAAGLLDNLREAAHILLVRALRPEVREPAGNIRLTIAQFGDYAEAYRRFVNGGDENYYAQRYTVILFHRWRRAAMLQPSQ